MFINWILIYTTPHIYLIQMCLYTVSMPQTTNEQTGVPLGPARRTSAAPEHGEGRCAGEAPMETVGKREGKMVTGTNRNMG